MASFFPQDDTLPDDLDELLCNTYDFLCDHIFHYEPYNYQVAIGIERLLRGSEELSERIEARQRIRQYHIYKYDHLFKSNQIECENFIANPLSYVSANDHSEIVKIIDRFDPYNASFLGVTFINSLHELRTAGNGLAVRVSRALQGVGYRVLLSLTASLQKRQEAYCDYRKRLNDPWHANNRNRKKKAPCCPSAADWATVEGFYVESFIIHERVSTFFRKPHAETYHDSSRKGKRALPSPASPSPDSKALPNLLSSPDQPPLSLTDALPKSPIILRGPDDDVVVRGKVKPRLTPAQYRVVKVLNDAYPDRLPLDTLAKRSNTDDPVGIIDRLCRDEDWSNVLDKPGIPHGGYGLRSEAPKASDT